MDALFDPRRIAQLRQALTDYTVDGLREFVGPSGRLALANGDLATLGRSLDDSPLSDLVRLFLLGQPIAWRRAVRTLAPLSVEDAVTAGLLTTGPGEVKAAYDLRPYAEQDGPSWWVLSDFGSDVRPGPVATDHVLGIGAASLSLAQATVRAPVGRALDVGTGCGVQALHLSRHCAGVTATDISPRALRLARTTADLNDLDWDLRLGSLLDPVADERFDLIVANPPFVISSGTVGHEYRDGGLAGDELCRRLVGAVSGRLEDGGTAQLLANWAIGPDGSWEERVSSWLGDSRCAAWIWQREVMDAPAYVALWLRDAGVEPGTAEWATGYDGWLRWFTEHGVIAVGMGLVNIRASTGPVVCEDVRQDVEQPIGASIAAWFEQTRRLSRLDDNDLLGHRLQLLDDVELVVEPVMAGNGIPGYRLRQTRGLRWDIESDEPMSRFISSLDGTVALDTQIRLLAAAHGLGVAECANAVLPILRDLLTRGLLRIV